MTADDITALAERLGEYRHNVMTGKTALVNPDGPAAATALRDLQARLVKAVGLIEHFCTYGLDREKAEAFLDEIEASHDAVVHDSKGTVWDDLDLPDPTKDRQP